MTAKDLSERIIVEVGAVVHTNELDTSHLSSRGDSALTNDGAKEIVEDSWDLYEGLE